MEEKGKLGPEPTLAQAGLLWESENPGPMDLKRKNAAFRWIQSSSSTLGSTLYTNAGLYGSAWVGHDTSVSDLNSTQDGGLAGDKVSTARLHWEFEAWIFFAMQVCYHGQGI